MPFDEIENLPSDNLEISENEKIILNNLYPEEIPEPQISILQGRDASITTQAPVPASPQKTAPSFFEDPKEYVKNKEVVIETSSHEDVPYLRIAIIVAIFIFLNHSSINNWIDRISPDYNIYVKILILSLILLILKYFKYL